MAMQHPDIQAWLASREDARRLEELECKAADAWFNTLSLEQRKVFEAFLVGGYVAISHLRGQVMSERMRAEREEKKIRFGKFE